MKSKAAEKFWKWCAVLVFGLFYATYRFRFYRTDLEEKARRINDNGPVCLSIWHRNSVACLLSYARRRLAILVSQSFDGEIIAYVGRAFGIHSARGSSTRGGTEAMRELIRLNRDGYDIGITVDGPTGPLYKVKAGIVAIAARNGNPILPYASIARKTWVLHKSWDGFRIPKPFSEILCLYGEPILVERRLSPDAVDSLALEIEHSLLSLEQRLEAAIATGTAPL